MFLFLAYEPFRASGELVLFLFVYTAYTLSSQDPVYLQKEFTELNDLPIR